MIINYVTNVAWPFTFSRWWFQFSFLELGFKIVNFQLQKKKKLTSNFAPGKCQTFDWALYIVLNHNESYGIHGTKRESGYKAES